MRKVKERGSCASPLGNLRARALKVFGENIGFESSRAGHEIAVEGSNYHYLHGEAKSAWQDAEYNKAAALMKSQRQQRFC